MKSYPPVHSPKSVHYRQRIPEAKIHYCLLTRLNSSFESTREVAFGWDPQISSPIESVNRSDASSAEEDQHKEVSVDDEFRDDDAPCGAGREFDSSHCVTWAPLLRLKLC